MLVSDSGPQFSSEVFTEFAKEYKFTHTTSSAHKLMAMIKSILDKTNDPYMGLLSYRCIPFRNGYSPSELLMGQNYVLHSQIPNELET